MKGRGAGGMFNAGRLARALSKQENQARGESGMKVFRFGFLRLYWPREQVAGGRWVPPPIMPAAE